MSFVYRFISVLLLSLPLLAVVLLWDHLPGRVPVHFGSDRQPDKFSSREEWFISLLFSLFFFNVIRALILRAVSRQRTLRLEQYKALFLLTAGFISGSLSLIVWQGIGRLPVYADWMPVLFFLTGSGFVYITVSPVRADFPETPTPVTSEATARRLATVQYVQTLSRLVVVRVNLLAVGLMFLVNRNDRWSVGLLANGLAYAYLFILAIRTNRKTSE